MKIINDEKAYITSILVLLLLIPVFVLLIITIDEYNHNIDNTIETIELNKIKTSTEDFEEYINQITKETLHNITLDVIKTNKPLINSKKELMDLIQDKLNQKIQMYRTNYIIIDCTIDNIQPADNPFMIELTYSISSTMKNSSADIKKKNTILIELTDKSYPIYDPLPTLKTGAIFTDNHVYYQDKLSKNIKLNNPEAYQNSIQSVVIRKCPYDDYPSHGNDNKTILNCIHNHYYHNSHDGMCLLCRLENKTNCNHYGFETFILPTLIMDKAPASIDHVLLNDINKQYDGNRIILDNITVLYLDNGHKAKYGL